MRHGRSALLLSVLLVAGLAVTPSAADLLPEHDGALIQEVDRGTSVLLDGYVPMTDGTLLRLQVDRPKAAPRVPTLLMYQGYTHLVDRSVHPAVGLQQWARENGYALMLATTRGTGCSGGEWDLLAEQEALDARDLIQWVVSQEWSDGKVAMIGESYAGFEQLRIASLRPSGLVAIAPGAPLADIYRDVAAPGGIPNTLLPGAFTATVMQGSLQAGVDELQAGGEDGELTDRCLRHQADRATAPTGPPAVQFAGYRWDGEELRERSPSSYDISLPMLALVAWQDELLGSRAIDSLARMTGPVHAVLSNGDHTNMWTSASYQEQLRAFLDFYVKGIDNGFDAQDRIQLWWETTRPPGQNPVLVSTPSWVDGVPRLPAPSARVTELQLTEGGALTDGAGSGPADSYSSVPGNGQARDQAVFPTYDPQDVEAADPQPSAWTLPAGDGLALAYTSQPLTKDLTALGSGSVDLSLSSSAPDTDVQVVLTEVRPDGQEMYVQAGWLRASHRVEDAALTEPTRPFHTHRSADWAPLVPGQVEQLRVEINPFGHVFRTGSRIRLWIEAPAKTFGLRSLEPLPFTSQNSVHHDAAHPSVLRLSTLPGRHAQTPHPECGTVIRQPCRPDPLAAPPAV